MLPYAKAVFDPETDEPGDECPVCGAFCPKRCDADGESTLRTYPDHFEERHVGS